MTKKKFISLLLVLALAISIIFFGANFKSANAKSEEYNAVTLNEEESASTYALVANLRMSIAGGNGEVSAVVKNTFTLFPGTVKVYVYLYYSEIYTEDYTLMELLATNYIGDLDQGKSIKATSNTNGKAGYWIGRMRYKVDGRDWAEKVTGVYECDSIGNIL